MLHLNHLGFHRMRMSLQLRGSLSYSSSGSGVSSLLGALGSKDRVKVIEIPDYSRVKDLSQILNIDVNEIETAFTLKSNRRYFTFFSGKWYQFPSINEVIIPFASAKMYCEKVRKLSSGQKRGRSSGDLVSVEKAPSFVSLFNLKNIWGRLGDNSNSNSNSFTHIPIIAILGHFNHGKTTLLDKLGGTSFCKSEARGITQVIRSRFIPINNNNNISNGNCNSNSSKHNGNLRSDIYNGCATFIDTPGQDIFYRMRNSGANKCDVALLVIAADQGIVEQTMESIGIVESLGCPVVVVINKIDTIEADSYSSRITELTNAIREYKALNGAPIVCISAKTGLNMALFEEILGAQLAVLFPNNKNNDNSNVGDSGIKNAAGFGAGMLSKAQGSVSGGGNDSSLGAVDSLLETVTAQGFVLDVGRSKTSGYFMQVLLQSGRLQSGDVVVSGGVRGTIKRLEFEDSIDLCYNRYRTRSSSVDCKESSNSNSNCNGNYISNESPRQHGSVDGGTINPKDVAREVAFIPGTVVRIILGVEDECFEPKPLGLSLVAFSTAAKTEASPLLEVWSQQRDLLRYLQTYNSQENGSGTGDIVNDSSGDSSSRSSSSSSSSSSSPPLSSVLKKTPSIHKLVHKHTLHIVDQDRMEMLLPNYELNDSQVEKFRLPLIYSNRFSSSWAVVDPFFPKLHENRISEKEGDSSDGDDGDGKNEDEEAVGDKERGSIVNNRSFKTKKSSLNSSNYKYDTPAPVTVVVKADTELALGTFQDCIADYIAENSPNTDDSSKVDERSDEDCGDDKLSEVCEVIRWGVGDISPSDVSIAKSSNSIILSYNTKVESLALEQMIQGHVKHVQVDRMQDAIRLLTSSMKFKLDDEIDAANGIRLGGGDKK